MFKTTHTGTTDIIILLKYSSLSEQFLDLRFFLFNSLLSSYNFSPGFSSLFQGRSPVSILAPSVRRISMKLRDITATRRRDSAQSGLIITFDRDYGNEAANYKKGLQAFRQERERKREREQREQVGEVFLKRAEQLRRHAV